MRYYPAFLDLNGKSCVVIGGGAVAERKVRGLIKACAAVTVVSPVLTTGLKALASKKAIAHKKRRYRDGDLSGASLVVSATGSREVNRKVVLDARRAGVLLNSVDDPPNCSFIVPSVVERGGLVIAVSTTGAAPALSRRLRVELEETYGPEYGCMVEIMGAVRRKLLKMEMSRVNKEKVLSRLASSDLAMLIRKGARPEINRLMTSLLGPGMTLSRLGVRLPEQGLAAGGIKTLKKTGHK
jgi:precorrin-2 dehydrogenase/sirohydrochlorin ferrochelatase